MLFRRVVVLSSGHQRYKSSVVAGPAAVQHFDDIPSPKGLPFIGTTLDLIASGSTPNLHNYVDKRHKQLGSIFKERLGPVSAVFVADAQEIPSVFAQEGRYPAHVLPEAWLVYNQLYGCRRGLFFMDGPNWAHHRKIMNKLLLKGQPDWIEKACGCVTDKLIQTIQSVSKNNTELMDLERMLYKWSLDVIVAVLIGSETYRNHSTDLDNNLDKLASKVRLVFDTSQRLQLIPATLASKLRIPPWKRFVRSVDEALDGANNLINQLLGYNLDKSGLLPKLLAEDIAPEDVKRIIADLILAAGDTTAYAMQWMLYSVAKNRGVQEELRNKSGLARNVLKETLRLYPVAPFLTRILPNPAVISGFEVPKNTLIILSIYTTGRSEKYYKNPLKFDPNRWDRDFNGDYHVDMQRASLPFAMGLRSCIGKKIAETQLQNAVLEIVKRFDVELLNEHEVDVVLKMVAVPSQPIRLKFKPLFNNE